MPRLYEPFPPPRQLALAKAVTEKSTAFPALAEQVVVARGLALARLLPSMRKGPGPGRLPVYEGRSITVLGLHPERLRFWVDVSDGRALLLGGHLDQGQPLSCDGYQLAIRRIARAADSRCLTATVVPSSILLDSLQGLWLPAATDTRVASRALLSLGALLSSLVVDFLLRVRLHGSDIGARHLVALPVPLLSAGDLRNEELMGRAARLVCTSSSFARLARDAGVPMGEEGDEAARGRLRAEIDGEVAHLYGLSEEEFQMVLSMYPLIPDPAKLAAHNAYRDIERGVRR